MIRQSGSKVFLEINDRWFYYDLNDKPIGAGAMGTVYLGRDYATNEMVAIKQVVDEYSVMPSIRKRAKDEAAFMFRHRNLIEMLGYCEAGHNNGPIFILSKFVQGVTIDKHVEQFLRHRKDALQRICKTMFPVFDALSYLHSKGIVHMDIKPSNIMLENGYNVRLMDLGIATTCTELKLAQGMVGTPKYAAPEQIYNPDKPNVEITPATDIYELGVTIYELLTGYNPFDSASREVTLKRQQTIILPESVKIPKAVLKVLRKATEKNPNNRFSSATEFKTALKRALNKKNTLNQYIIFGIIGVVMATLLIIYFSII